MYHHSIRTTLLAISTLTKNLQFFRRKFTVKTKLKRKINGKLFNMASDWSDRKNDIENKSSVREFRSFAPDKRLQCQDLKSYSEFKNWFTNIDVVMFDCDGVIWMGNTVIKNANSLVIKLREMGKRVYFITNNSSKTRDEFLQKFEALGFETTLDEIVGSSHLAALYLKEQKFQGKAYVIGTTGITKELNAVGIRTLPIGPDSFDCDTVWGGANGETVGDLDPQVGAVVVGFDHHFSYKKLMKAASYLNDPECIFIATNTDERFPSSNHRIIVPGTGSIVNAVRTAAEREPIVMGKPSTIPFDLINKEIGLNPSRTLMIGDRANTDILFGTKCEMWTLLVLTGVTQYAEVVTWMKSEDKEHKKLIPNFCIDDVDSLYSLILANEL